LSKPTPESNYWLRSKRVRQGKQFLSGGVPRKAKITRSHEVEFYPDDAAFVVGFTVSVRANTLLTDLVRSQRDFTTWVGHTLQSKTGRMKLRS
jgi:hypothetical protein